MTRYRIVKVLQGTRPVVFYVDRHFWFGWRREEYLFGGWLPFVTFDMAMAYIARNVEPTEVVVAEVAS